MRRAVNHLRARRAGLTLAELSVSLAIIATLMVAIGSIMALTGRDVGMTAAQASESKVDDLVATMASEQRMALSVNELTPTSITFTVADRNGDGQPEKISYFLSSDGTRLMRQVNGAAAVQVLANVTSLKFNWISQLSAAPAPVVLVESTTDDLMFAHETGGTSAQSISQLAWAGQSFMPALRADAASWRVTQVQIMATRSAANYTGKTWNVMLCPTNALGKPDTLNPIETRTLLADTLKTTVGWSPVISFTTAQNLDPKQRYWIVVGQGLLSTSFGSVSFDPASTDAADPYGSTTTASTLWTTYTARDMKIRVYGRYKYPQP
jgi:hypothetical protein